MRVVLKYLNLVTDNRQKKKVLHKMSDIIALVFFSMLVNANEWVEIEAFGKEHETFLRKYLELPNGIPSHDTIQRVFAMVSSECLQGFHSVWNEMLNSGEGEKIKKILAIDGKTQCGNGNKNQKANHIISVADENGFCLGEKCVNEKTNEITAIPDLLDVLHVKGHIITTDAMGCQTQIVKQIRKKKADYVLAVKGNQPSLHDDIKLYFNDSDLLKKCTYTKTIEKARSGMEKQDIFTKRRIDWNFIYGLVKDTYDIGHPSMDPVMLIKIPFIQYLYGIRSMRQTIKEIEVNIAYH
jgi:predicted transposase YbfD/YdcC